MSWSGGFSGPAADAAVQLTVPSDPANLGDAEVAQLDAANEMIQAAKSAFEGKHVSVSAYGHASPEESGSTLNVSVASIIPPAPAAEEPPAEEQPAEEAAPA